MFSDLTVYFAIFFETMLTVAHINMKLKQTNFPNRITTPHPAYSFLNTISYHFIDDVSPPGTICSDHDHELLRPQLISTWMPNGVGSMPGKRVVFSETQVGLALVVQ